MLNAFVHLYLGHLFGDYVLQTSWIAANKPKMKRVLLIHVFLVYLSQMFFLAGKGFLWKGFLVSTIIAALHYVIDTVKIKTKSNSWKGYVIDQVFHLLTVLASMYFVADLEFWIPFPIASKLMLSIFNAYLLGLFAFFYVNTNSVYKRDWLGYGLRAALPWITNILWFSLVSVIGTVGLAFYYRKRRKEFLLSTLHSILITIVWEVLT